MMSINNTIDLCSLFSPDHKHQLFDLIYRYPWSRISWKVCGVSTSCELCGWTAELELELEREVEL